MYSLKDDENIIRFHSNVKQMVRLELVYFILFRSIRTFLIFFSVLIRTRLIFFSVLYQYTFHIFLRSYQYTFHIFLRSYQYMSHIFLRSYQYMSHCFVTLDDYNRETLRILLSDHLINRTTLSSS